MTKAGAQKPERDERPAWVRGLLRRKTDDGWKLRQIAANAITILANEPRWGGVLAYDEFAETIVARKPPPWREQDAPPDAKPGDWTDEDTVRVQAWLAQFYGLDVGLEAALGAVKVTAAKNRFHPVREWLRELRWDGKRRASTWLIDVMGCPDSAYVREVGASFLVGAVARIFTPGCKVDTVPIFEGEQGTFKSSVIRAIAGDEWFLEMAVTDIANKDAMQVLRRKWIVEFPEWDGFSKAEQSHVKGYCSRQVDTYRPSYGKGTRDFPRQAAFTGSTNKYDWSTDETGARRYRPLRCKVGNVALARELRDQLWAEAVALFDSGVAWHVTDPELEDQFKAEQESRFRPHPFEEPIALWLERPVDIPLGKRRADIGVTTTDVLEGALRIDVGKRTQGDANAVAACLRRLGWRQAPQSRRNGAQVRLFFPFDAGATLTAESPSGVVEIGRRADEGDIPTEAEYEQLGWPT